jgi:hypothetical protein
MKYKSEIIYQDDNYCVTLYKKSNALPTIIAFSNREEKYKEKSDFAREFGKNALLSLDCNYISFVTNENCWYQNSMASSIEATNIVLSSMNSKVITYGNSMGAFAAINFANSLSAEFLSFSPQASLESSFMDEIDDKRWQEESRILNPFQSDILKGNCSERKGYVFYDSQHVDRKHAEVILKYTKGVKCDLPFSGHGSVSGLNITYGLKKLINELYLERKEPDEILHCVNTCWESSLEYLSMNPKDNYDDFIVELEYSNFKLSNISLRNMIKSLTHSYYPKDFDLYIPKIIKNNDWLTCDKIEKLKLYT